MRSPATPDEIHAAEHECAEASVAMYEAQEAARVAGEGFLEEVHRPFVHDDFQAAWRALSDARVAYSAAAFRHRNAVTAYVAIRPDPQPGGPNGQSPV